jgi:hypothetical protein
MHAENKVVSISNSGPSTAFPPSSVVQSEMFEVMFSKASKSILYVHCIYIH